MSVFIWQTDAWDKIKEMEKRVSSSSNAFFDGSDNHKLFNRYVEMFKKSGICADDLKHIPKAIKEKLQKINFSKFFKIGSDKIMVNSFYFFSVDCFGELTVSHDFIYDYSCEVYQKIDAVMLELGFEKHE